MAQQRVPASKDLPVAQQRKRVAVTTVFADDSCANAMPLKRGRDGGALGGRTKISASKPSNKKAAKEAPPPPKSKALTASTSSKGVPSSSALLCGVKFRDIGLLPPVGPAADKFVECCSNFHVPKVERDLLGVPNSHLAGGGDFHLISNLLLYRAFRQQSLAYQRKLEGDIAELDKKILSLENEVAELKKSSHNDRARKVAAELEIEKAKGELAKSQNERALEVSALTSRVKDMVESLRQALFSVGCDAQLPEGDSLDSFVSWLEAELFLLDGNITVNRDITAATAMKAICDGLIRAGCGHLDGLDLSEVDDCRAAGSEVNRIGNALYNSFWNNGGDDVASMNTAVSRASTDEGKAAIRRMVEEYLLRVRAGFQVASSTSGADGTSVDVVPSGVGVAADVDQNDDEMVQG